MIVSLYILVRSTLIDYLRRRPCLELPSELSPDLISPMRLRRLWSLSLRRDSRTARLCSVEPRLMSMPSSRPSFGNCLVHMNNSRTFVGTKRRREAANRRIANTSLPAWSRNCPAPRIWPCLVSKGGITAERWPHCRWRDARPIKR